MQLTEVGEAEEESFAPSPGRPPESTQAAVVCRVMVLPGASQAVPQATLTPPPIQTPPSSPSVIPAMRDKLDEIDESPPPPWGKAYKKA